MVSARTSNQRAQLSVLRAAGGGLLARESLVQGLDQAQRVVLALLMVLVQVVVVALVVGAELVELLAGEQLREVGRSEQVGRGRRRLAGGQLVRARLLLLLETLEQTCVDGCRGGRLSGARRQVGALFGLSRLRGAGRLSVGGQAVRPVRVPCGCGWRSCRPARRVELGQVVWLAGLLLVRLRLALLLLLLFLWQLRCVGLRGGRALSNCKEPPVRQLLVLLAEAGRRRRGC